MWLPLVAEHENETLIPPVDIAWVWHLHRLAPLRYASYCKERFGKVLDPAAAFQAQTETNEQLSADERNTRGQWAHAFGEDVPFPPAPRPDATVVPKGTRD